MPYSRVGSDFTKNLDGVVTHLQSDDSAAAFVFANSCRLTVNLKKSLEGKTDKKGIHSDVVHIHGMLDKDEKFILINLFCGKITIDKFEPRALVSTSSVDLGVDHPNAQYVLENQWSESPSTYVQGR